MSKSDENTLLTIFQKHYSGVNNPLNDPQMTFGPTYVDVSSANSHGISKYVKRVTMFQKT